MKKNNKNEYDYAIKAMRIFEGRNKIIAHNNLCILETVSFYDIVFFEDIIKPYIFKELIQNNTELTDFFSEKLGIMDKYKFVCKISKINNIKPFKGFDEFIKYRNMIAHNLSYIENINFVTKESKINFCGEKMSWAEYKNRMKRWANLSFQMAQFTMNLFDSINKETKDANFVYCKIEGENLLVQYNLIYPEIKGNYVSFFKNGIDHDLIDFMVD